MNGSGPISAMSRLTSRNSCFCSETHHPMKPACHCGRFAAPPMTRRNMLLQCANGFGAVALWALLGDKAFGGVPPVRPLSPAPAGSMAPRPPHYAAKARNVIFLYMDGGPSQVDTFDPKPRLQKEHGQPFKM